MEWYSFPVNEAIVQGCVYIVVGLHEMDDRIVHIMERMNKKQKKHKK